MDKMKPCRMGRPPLPKGQRKSVQLVFRVDPALHKRILKAAKREGKPLAAWVRATLTESVRGE